jgi:hypothetical protein
MKKFKELYSSSIEVIFKFDLMDLIPNIYQKFRPKS